MSNNGGPAGTTTPSPMTTLPRGWFQVGWSAGLGPGAVTPMRYFGRDLVMYRGEGGRVHVLDAHCPHLGAHLGYGGRCAGDDLVCPFHGWRWDGDGRNVEIPYSTRTQRTRLGTWDVRERNGMIYVWHDPTGAGPTWEPPAITEASSADFVWSYPECVKAWRDLPFPGQFLIENTVDVAHFQYIHRSSEPARVRQYEADGPFFRVLLDNTFPGPKGPQVGEIEIVIWGVGGANTLQKFGRHCVMFAVGITPVEQNRSDLFGSVMVRKVDGSATLTESMQAVVDVQLASPEEDFPIWSHMRYVERPPLVGEEAKPYRALREWTRQFYVDTPAAVLADASVAGAPACGW